MNENELTKLLEFLMSLPFFIRLNLFVAVINQKMKKMTQEWNRELNTGDLIYNMGFSILVVNKKTGAQKNILVATNFENTYHGLSIETEAVIMGPPHLIVENIDELSERINQFLDIKSAQLILGSLVAVQLDEEILDQNKKENDSLRIIFENAKKQNSPENMSFNNSLNDTDISVNPIFSITNPALKRTLKISINPELLVLSTDLMNFLSPPPPSQNRPFSLN